MRVPVRRNLRVIVLCLLTTAMSCHSSKEIRTRHVPGQNNAIWAESIYFRGFRPSTGEKLTDQKVQHFAEKLGKYNITYAYVFAGPYDSTGHLPDYAYSETAIRSVKLMKRYNPDLQIVPWIGGVQNRTVYLGDSTWMYNALTDTKRLIETLGVPGVHVDFEYILAGNTYLDRTIKKEKIGDLESYGNNVNEFHRKLRTLVPQAFISSVVVSTSPGTKPWKRKTTMTELKTLSKYVDQLSFLYYDTQIDNNLEFKKNFSELAEDIKELKISYTDSRVQYLVAVGTFVNVPELQGYRNLEIESIPNTLTTIREVLSSNGSLPNQEIVDGIALFCDWQTDIEEYEQFYRYWASR